MKKYQNCAQLQQSSHQSLLQAHTHNLMTDQHQNQEQFKDSLLSAQNNNRPTQTTTAISQSENNQFQLTPLQHLLDKVGGEHKYQFRIFMIFNLMWFLTSWMLVGQGFFFDSRYECYNYQNFDECQDYICNTLKTQQQRMKAIKSHAHSIVFTFQNQYFICENAYLLPILTSLIYAGSLIGFFVIPYIADNWGRRLAIRISWAIFVFGIAFVGLADSPNMIGVGQLMCGFGCNPAITLCYSFLNQQVLGAKRQYYGVIIQVFLALGQCTIAFMFLPNYSWRVVCFILLGLVAVNWVLLNYLIESPKFLISKSKQKTLESLNKIAVINNRPLLQQSQLDTIKTIDESKSQGTSIIDLFKYKSLRKSTIAGGMVFLAIQVIYYGTLLNLDHIGLSKLVNQEIIGVSQGLGYIAAEIVISRIYRKKWSLVGMGMSTGFCFILALLTGLENDSNQTIMKVFETIGLVLNRFVLCAFWGLFYVFIAELYPTKVRSMGFGWTSAMGTVGSTLAPYIVFFSIKIGVNSWLPLGVIGFIGFLSIFLLNETFKKPLYDDIEEVRIKGKWELSDDQGQTGEEGESRQVQYQVMEQKPK